MLVKRQVLLAEIESTYNTDPLPTGADNAIEVENLRVIQHEGLRMADRPSIRQTVGARSKVYGGSLRRVTFDCELKGSGTAGTPPEIDPLLRACGLGVTNVPATSDTYQPVSSSYESVTIYAYADEDGTSVRHIITGCRGSFTLSLETGQPGKLSFSMVGHLVDETDQTSVTPTYDTTVPVPFLSAGFTVDAFSGVINALALDMGQEISTPPDANAADGYAEVQITGREITGSVDPEAELLATFTPFAKFRAGTTVVVATGVVGSTAGNRWQFNAPTAQYMDITDADREGVIAYELPLLFAEAGAGDNEFTLAFT